MEGIDKKYSSELTIHKLIASKTQHAKTYDSMSNPFSFRWERFFVLQEEHANWMGLWKNTILVIVKGV